MPDVNLADLERRFNLMDFAFTALAGGLGGRQLTKVSNADYDYAWQDAAPVEVKIFRGNPNTVVQGKEGQLGTDVDGHVLYINTDGLTTWIVVGGGGANTFPVGPFDDTTGTHELLTEQTPTGAFGTPQSDTVNILTHDSLAVSSQQSLRVSDIGGQGYALAQINSMASRTPASDIAPTAVPGAWVQTGLLLGVSAQSVMQVDDGAGNGAVIQVLLGLPGGLSSIAIGGNGTAACTIQLGESGDSVMGNNFPIVNPGAGSKIIWNDAGTLKVA